MVYVYGQVSLKIFLCFSLGCFVFVSISEIDCVERLYSSRRKTVYLTADTHKSSRFI